MRVVKRFGVLSVGKIMGCLYALIGMIVGGLLSLVALAGAAAGGQNAGPAGVLFGVGAVIIIPVFYGVLGFIGGIISAALYNVLAGAIGGIEIEFERVVDDYAD